MTTHTQCELSKKIDQGETHEVAWIETKLAIPGEFVRIRINGVWDDGWKVISAGAVQDSTFTRERSQDYKNMRKMTDI